MRVGLIVVDFKPIAMCRIHVAGRDRQDAIAGAP